MEREYTLPFHFFFKGEGMERKKYTILFYFFWFEVEGWERVVTVYKNTIKHACYENKQSKNGRGGESLLVVEGECEAV
jgi:hypothetical protein